MLSVIIPVLNAGDALASALESLKAWPEAMSEPMEVIVCDGGSTDDGPAIAGRMGARVVTSARGRGIQMRAGVKTAQGDWFLFLHADTVLSPDWPAAARALIDSGAEAAGYFRFRLDDEAESMEPGVAWRSRVLALPYGDQGMLISRALYDRVGGFKPVRLMEDVDLAGRLGPARLRALDADAVTSSVRYRKMGYAKRITVNIICLALYTCGFPTALIDRLYR